MDGSEQRAELKRVLQVVRSGNFLVLDTETTGLNDGEVCEVCLIDQDGEVVYYSLVKPVRGIPADATKIHGITNERVADAPSFAVVAPHLMNHLLDRDVLVYNAVYDRKMLHKSAEAVGRDHIAWKEFSRWGCAMEAFAALFGDYNDYRGTYTWKKLSQAAAYYGIRESGAHNALSDCLTTLEVVKNMLADFNSTARDDEWDKS